MREKFEILYKCSCTPSVSITELLATYHRQLLVGRKCFMIAFILYQPVKLTGCLSCLRIRQVNLQCHSPSLMRYIEHLILRAVLPTDFCRPRRKIKTQEKLSLRRLAYLIKGSFIYFLWQISSTFHSSFKIPLKHIFAIVLRHVGHQQKRRNKI